MNFEQLLKLTPSSQFGNRGNRNSVLEVPLTERNPLSKNTGSKELQAPRGMSEIKVVNGFSPNSEYMQYDSRVSNSNLESSLCNDLRLWEQICDVDKTIIQNVEKGFIDIDDQIQSLAAQFDVCFNLQQKGEEKFMLFQKIVKGAPVTKFSRSNCKKTMPRNFYYCSYWDALCWKPTSQRYPKPNQMISVTAILQVHTNVAQYRKTRKSFMLPQWADPDCFLAIEARKNCFLEILTPDNVTRNLFAKVIEALVANQGRAVETNFLMTQYGMDVNNIRRMLDTTRQLFGLNIEKLKQSFIKTTQMMISEERQKAKRAKQHSQTLTLKTKATVEELLLEKQMLVSKVSQLESKLSMRFPRSPEIAYINNILQDILANNGDCSIQNESNIGSNHTDCYQDCCMALERLRVHMETSSNIEVQLRQELNDLQETYQTQIVEVRQSQNKLQLERDGLIQANEELALKLDQFQGIILEKEEQFSSVVREMREVQLSMQRTLRRNSTSEQMDAYRLKQIDVQFSEFKQKWAIEEKGTSKLLGGVVALISYFLIPQDLSLAPETIISNLIKSIPFILESESNQFFQDIATQLNSKLQAQNAECWEILIDQVRQSTLALRYMGFKMSMLPNVTIFLECSSPSSRPLAMRKTILSTAGPMNSPPMTSNRTQTQF